MKIELSDVDGLPENIRGLAVQDGDKFALDLSQLAPVSEVDRYKGKALTAEQESIERRKALKAWADLGESPEAVRQKMTAGLDPQILDQFKAQSAKELSEVRAQLAKERGSATIDKLKAELAAVGVFPDALDMVANHARSMIQFDDDGAVRIVGSDGKPMIGGGANGGATLSDLAASLAKSMPRLVADNGQGGGGKQPGTGGTPKSAITRSQFDAMSSTERTKFIRGGGSVTEA